MTSDHAFAAGKVPGHAMRIRRFESPDAAAAALALRVADTVTARPDLVLGLPAGRTMLPVYAELRRLHRLGAFDTSRLRVFDVDEFVGLSPGAPGSFRGFLERHLLDALDLRPRQMDFIDGAAPDAEAECERYERAIVEAGGIDLQLLGIGSNGHIGFNEPGEQLAVHTHLAHLHDRTRAANAVWFGGDEARVPSQALSMGMATILSARTIALIAGGTEKAAAVAAAIDGPLTTRIPASFLQLHSHVEIYLDREAASRLTPRPAD